MVIGFDGPNYTGKSTFVNNLKEKLTNEGYIVEIFKPFPDVSELERLRVVNYDDISVHENNGFSMAYEIANVYIRAYCELGEKIRSFEEEHGDKAIAILDRTLLATYAYSMQYLKAFNSEVVYNSLVTLFSRSLISAIKSDRNIVPEFIVLFKADKRTIAEYRKERLKNAEPKVYNGREISNIIYESDEMAENQVEMFDEAREVFNDEVISKVVEISVTDVDQKVLFNNITKIISMHLATDEEENKETEEESVEEVNIFTHTPEEILGKDNENKEGDDTSNESSQQDSVGRGSVIPSVVLAVNEDGIPLDFLEPSTNAVEAEDEDDNEDCNTQPPTHITSLIKDNVNHKHAYHKNNKHNRR